MADNHDANVGHNMPYGPAIREAMASGDRARINAASQHAERWLADNPGHHNHGDVKAALRELNEQYGS